MKRLFVLFTTITCILISADVNFYVEDFEDNGSSATFNIKMDNTVDIYGIQMEVLVRPAASFELSNENDFFEEKTAYDVLMVHTSMKSNEAKLLCDGLKFEGTHDKRLSKVVELANQGYDPVDIITTVKYD